MDQLANKLEAIEIARVCHEVNKAYSESQYDYTHKHWEDAPEWQKESAIKGVEFLINNPKATPEDSHKSWVEEKEKTGWVYGPIKDSFKKTHPCLVDYHALPPEQRAKDYIFQGIVRALMK